MAILDYQLILFPKGNKPELTENGMDFIGPNNFNFNKAVSVIRSIEFVKNYSPESKWPSFDDICYYCFDNGKSIVEIQINSGVQEEKAELISIRTNIFKDTGSIEIAIEICKKLCEDLDLLIWDMKLKDLINIEDKISIMKTLKRFKLLRAK
ncbi:hypothetical protein H8B09_29715 [Paenibacillus sp. PR3]|uniref:Uncharacterized protein n=1 Tax=Paenibacillus terricola TaxID=2763503 RepID=A0ABR8N425_9BACL|nr:hypothetical protein [Paenibacillus terricola]MBD3922922.1 hypothetical protein [Paenibacillus terricola]